MFQKRREKINRFGNDVKNKSFWKRYEKIFISETKRKSNRFRNDVKKFSFQKRCEKVFVSETM